MTTQVPESMLDIDGLLDVVVPLGACLPYYGATAPGSRWLFPHGQAVSRTTYATLFALFGTTFGVGDGSTTFNLPDHRGRIAVGKDDMGGAAASRVTTAGSGVNGLTLGAVGGSQLMQTHNHAVTDPGHVHSSVVASGQATDGPAGFTVAGGSNSSATTGITLGAAGSGSSQNMQPSIVANVILRVL